MKAEDVFDKEVVEVYTIKQEIQGLTRAEKQKLITEKFREKYNGKSVTMQMLDQDFFVYTDKNTASKYKFRDYWRSTTGEHDKKLSLALNDDYLTVMDHPCYEKTVPELKQSQNKLHEKTKQYHTFKKKIIVDDVPFDVKITVREFQDQRLFVYDVILKETKKELERKERSITQPASLNDSGFKDNTSSTDNIPHTVSNVKQEDVKLPQNSAKGKNFKSSLEQQMQGAKEKQEKIAVEKSKQRDEEISL